MLKPRKRLVKAKLKEDKLLIYTAKTQNFLQSSWKTIAYGLAAVIIIVGVLGIIIASQRANRIESAFEELMIRDAYQRGEFDETLTHINAVLDDFSGTPSAAAALMLKGRIHQQRSEYESAKEAFIQVTQKYSDCSYLAFGAYFALGAIAYGQEHYVEAAQFYQDAARRYPKHFNAPVALLVSGDCFKKTARYDDAKRTYQMILKQYSKSRSADKARNNLADLEFMK